MSIVEIGGPSKESTVRQRWAHFFTLLVSILVFAYGFVLRQNILNATELFRDISVGIEAQYPAGWLLDTSGDYVMRVRDMSRTGYKTTIQVSIQPVSADTSERNIVDRLARTRARTLTAYSVSPAEPFALREDLDAQSVFYSYVSRETSPFLEGIPQVVAGTDILAIARGQVIIVSFRSEASEFDALYPVFERFLQTLEF